MILLFVMSGAARFAAWRCRSGPGNATVLRAAACRSARRVCLAGRLNEGICR